MIFQQPDGDAPALGSESHCECDRLDAALFLVIMMISGGI